MRLKMTLQEIIETAWQEKDTLTTNETLSNKAKEAVFTLMNELDVGRFSVAEKKEDQWITHQWIKKGILLSFKFFPMVRTQNAYDKIPLKCASWEEKDFMEAGFRMVPGAIVRKGAYVAPQAILMPSFINCGAYVDESTMIDTWSTIGSCAQIGKRCHISGGVGIGGVLEPVQANPVIIEDDCFIGARSEIAEGVIVEKGSVISMGVFIGQSTKERRKRSTTGAFPRIVWWFLEQCQLQILKVRL
jgi:2,3,4,5-tetrahydropyridine-2-carboxylate N-succinyltransferase